MADDQRMLFQGRGVSQLHLSQQHFLCCTCNVRHGAHIECLHILSHMRAMQVDLQLHQHALRVHVVG